MRKLYASIPELSTEFVSFWFYDNANEQIDPGIRMRDSTVMLSAAKHLDRPFAEFTLSGTNVLRVTVEVPISSSGIKKMLQQWVTQASPPCSTPPTLHAIMNPKLNANKYQKMHLHAAYIHQDQLRMTAHDRHLAQPSIALERSLPGKVPAFLVEG